MRVLDLLIDVAAVAALTAVAAGGGMRLLSLLGIRGGDRDETWLFGTVAGLLVLAYATLALGELHLLYPALLLCLLVAAAPSALRELRDPPKASFLPLPLTILGLAAFCNLLFNHVPAAEIDEMVYHLAFPRLFVDAHAIVERYDNFCMHYTLTGEMLFTAGMLLRGPGLAKLWSWAFGLLAAAAVYVGTRRLTRDDTASQWAAVLYYLIPLSSLLSGSAYPDHYAVMAGVMAVPAFEIWRGSRETRWLLLCGACVGAAMSARYSSVGMVFAISVLAILDWKQSRPFPVQTLLLRGSQAFALVLLAMSPWLIRNLIIRGNPLYPRPLLGLPYDALWQMWASAKAPGSAGETARALLDVPLALLFSHPTNALGPVIAAFLPLATSVRPFPKGSSSLAALLAACVVPTALLLPVFNPRYYMLAGAWAAGLASLGMLTAWRSGGPARYWLAVLAAAALAIPGLAFPAHFAAKRLPWHLGRITEDQFLEKHMEDKELPWPMMRHIARWIPEGTGVFCLGQILGSQYYLPRHRIIGMDAYPPAFYQAPLLQALESFQRDEIAYLVFGKGQFRDSRVFTHMEPRNPLPVTWFSEGLEQGDFERVHSEPSADLYRIRFSRIPVR